MIRVAIIGAGIGREHLAGYLALPDIYAVKTICDLDTEKANAAVKGEAGGDANITVSSDLAAVLADDSIDLVDVCLPPHLHFSTSIEALQAGKHVVCEKPMVTSLAEADQLVAAAKAAGRILSPVFQCRFGPAMTKLLALTEAELTGKPFVAALETHWNRDAAYYSVPWRGNWAGENGGAVLGHAIHNHDLLTSILGPVSRLSAFVGTRVNNIEVEDCASVSLLMASGAMATSSITLGAADNTSRIRICFEKLIAQSGNEPYAPMVDDWTFTARAPGGQDAVDKILASVGEAHSEFAGFFEALHGAISGKTNRAVTVEDGRQSIELVTAIYDAARSGNMISLPLDATNQLYQGWKPIT